MFGRKATIGVALAAGCMMFAVSAFAQDDAADKSVLRGHMNTLYGPVGLITVPTAYVTSTHTVDFGMDFAKDKSVTGNYGIVSGVDVGAAFIDRDGGSGRTFGNAKVNIIPANFKGFELGIGVIDVADTWDRTSYAIASADFATPEYLEKHVIGVRLHAGFGNGLFREKLIGGAELVLNKKFAVIGEYNGFDTNIALRYVHDKAFRIQAGVQGHSIFAGTTYGLTF